VKYVIPYGGAVTKAGVWTPKEKVFAVAYDNPIPGWKTENAINLRLWAGEPVEEFDLASFNVGEYTVSRAAMDAAATISSVLYPEDSTPAGKMLRLKQQFFFTSASLQVPTRLLPPLPSSRTSRIMHRW
jgi:starch phosphorylase